MKDVIPHIFRVFFNKVASFILSSLFDEKISLQHQISNGLVSRPFGKIGKNAELKTGHCPSKHYRVLLFCKGCCPRSNVLRIG